VDDGLDGSHPEFAGRFQLSSSYNFISGTQNPYNASDSHGTSCAGISVGAMNNSVCGSGIAYRASVSGIRYIGYASSTTAAQALTTYSAGVDVSSNSWGKVFRLGRFVAEASATQDALFTLADAGAIPLFAAGNQHREFSYCSHQELTTSPYLIVVAAHNDKGTKSAYSSECANVFIAAPSGDSSYVNSTRLYITTAATGGGCTNYFSGTSAATPTVSGVVALMKQANPSLTLREVQHIFINNSDPIDSSDPSWVTNGAGYRHSNKYGFGKLNAYKAVNAAKNWNRQLLPISYTAGSTTSPLYRAPNFTIPDNGSPLIDTVTASLDPQASVEHVGIYITSSHTASNQLKVSLTSPSGTVAVLTRPFATTAYYD
jgi:subtilisin family serine protease